MAIPTSPLRYPGGKQILARVLAHLVHVNKREGGIYAEPYAGGGGAALSLLYGEHVQLLLLNDADRNIFAFWDSVLNKTSRFLKLLETTPVTIREWERQREVYRHPSRHSLLRLGFATFYLNRCNRSGIIGNGSVIGGLDQTGKWKIDARFNRVTLRRRIERIALYRDRIRVSNMDALQFLRGELSERDTTGRAFVYLDPPYFGMGDRLYLNAYQREDHRNLSRYLIDEASFVWVLSYDNCRQIRDLYREVRRVRFALGYSAREWRLGRELLIFKPDVTFPERWKTKIPGRFISAADNVIIPSAG